MKTIIIYFIILWTLLLAPLLYVAFGEYIKLKIGADYFKKCFIIILNKLTKYVDWLVKFTTANFVRFVLFFVFFLVLTVGISFFVTARFGWFLGGSTAWLLIGFLVYFYKAVEDYLKIIKFNLNSGLAATGISLWGVGWTLTGTEIAFLTVKYFLFIGGSYFIIQGVALAYLMGAIACSKFAGFGEANVVSDLFFRDGVTRLSRILHDFHDFLDKVLRPHFDLPPKADASKPYSPVSLPEPPFPFSDDDKDAREVPPAEKKEERSKWWIVGVVVICIYMCLSAFNQGGR